MTAWAVLPAAELQRCWDAVVEEVLCSAHHGTDDRRAVGLGIVRRLLPVLPPTHLAIVLSPGVLHVILSNLAQDEHVLHGAARATVKTLAEVADTVQDDTALLALVAALTGPHGSRRFDTVTQTQTVATLLAALKPEGVEQFVQQLLKAFVTPEVEHVEDALSSRAAILDQLHAIVRNASVPRSGSLVRTLAKFLFFHAHFDAASDVAVPAELRLARGVPQPPIATPTRDLCQTRFGSVLGDLLTPPPPPPSATTATSGAVAAPAAAAQSVTASARPTAAARSAASDESRTALEEVVLFATAQLTADGVTMHRPLADATRTALVQLMDLIEKADKCARLRTPKVRTKGSLLAGQSGHDMIEVHKAFHVLFLHLALELFVETESSDATATVADLEQAYSEFTTSGQSTARRGKKRAHAEDDGDADGDADADEEEAPPHASEVLMDVLLSFLSRPSAMLRRMVDGIFPTVAHSLTHNALDLLFEVLEQPLGAEAGTWRGL